MVEVLGTSIGIGAVGGLFSTLLWGLLGAGLVGVFIYFLNSKMKYKYNVLVIKRRDSKYKTINDDKSDIVISGKGGYFKQKNTGRTEFRIKTGSKPSDQIVLTKMPDPRYMIGNLVIYQQVQKDNMVQSEINTKWTVENEKGYEVEISPVEDDTKHSAWLDMAEVEKVLNADGNKAVKTAATVLGFIIVGGIIVFWFLRDA